MADLVYLGYHPPILHLTIPHKKPKSSEFSDEEQTTNTVLTKVSILVEHVIRGIKRHDIAVDIFRNTRVKLIDLSVEVAADLCNLINLYRGYSFPITI